MEQKKKFLRNVLSLMRDVLTAGSTASSPCCPVHGNAFGFSSFDVVRNLDIHGPRFTISEFNRGFISLKRQSLCVDISAGDQCQTWLKDEEKGGRTISCELKNLVSQRIDRISYLESTCSCNVMCLDVGRRATVYHPMNSSDGKTCLSVQTVEMKGNEVLKMITDIGHAVRQGIHGRLIHCLQRRQVQKCLRFLLHVRFVFLAERPALKYMSDMKYMH